jgi:outer membrane lipoprotein-sorting protein
MIKITALLLALLVPASAWCQVNAQDMATSLTAKNQAVRSLRAVVSSTETRAGRDETTTFILSLSRTDGWKIEGADSTTTFSFINDFKNDLRLFGALNEAQLFRSEGRPELERIFRKPSEDMNPLAALDPSTLIYKGTDEMDGTTVHRFAGSTTTQFMQAADPLLLRREIWVGAEDGLSRRTVESVDGQISVTVYSQLEVNLPFRQDIFSTTPPKSFKLVDVNAQVGGVDTGTSMTTAVVSLSAPTSGSLPLP